MDSTTLRPLANKFLPFLSCALKLIPGLLRRQSPSIDANRAAAILEVYRLVLDCMYSISPCIAGNSSFILVERGGLVCFLELWGKYEEAKEEGASVLKKLGIDVGCGVCGGLDDREPEIVDLVAKVVCSHVRCVYKRQSNDGDEYEWVLGLVELVGPKLRCQKTSERAKQMLQENGTTLLQVAITSFKLSLGTSSNHQKGLFLLNCVISSEWIMPRQLEFLITELGIVVASLYHVGQLKQVKYIASNNSTIWQKMSS